MSFDDTIPDIWCLMTVETCFLAICNDLGWGFWPKNLHFFWFLKVEGKKMVLEVWTGEFCTKTVRYLTHAVW